MAPVFLDGERLGIARIAISRASLDRDLASLRRQSWLLGLTWVVVGLLAGQIMIIRPLRDLTPAAKAIADGEHDRQPSIRSRGDADSMPAVQITTKVLVVEDNVVNQDIIIPALVRLGCRATLAEGGEEAVQAFEQGSFDLVFMDCQMPGMDGFEATRAIRDLEKAAEGRDRTPIIALTANAMAGDRDLCLAAGMDDYVTKPFRYNDLATVFARWLRDGGSLSGELDDLDAVATTELVNAADAAASRAIDPAALRRIRQMAGSKGDDLLVEIIGRYLENTPDLLMELAAAMEKADYEKILHFVHSLNSSSANLGASQLSERCKQVENTCRTGAFDDIEDGVEKIVVEYETVTRALRAERTRIKAGIVSPSVPSPPIPSAPAPRSADVLNL